jgi:multiple sugar transport system ATP-binding protein
MELYDHPANQFVAGFIGSPPMNFFEGIVEQSPKGLFFNEGNFSVRIVDAQASKMSPFAGKTVVFGIRPEISAMRSSSPIRTPHQVKSRVEVVEPMGAEVYLYLNTGKHVFIARVNVRDNARVNQDLNVVFNMKKTHFFDQKTGMTVV